MKVYEVWKQATDSMSAVPKLIDVSCPSCECKSRSTFLCIDHATKGPGRNWVCVEKDADYHAVAAKRIAEHHAAPKQGTLAV